MRVVAGIVLGIAAAVLAVPGVALMKALIPIFGLIEGTLIGRVLDPLLYLGAPICAAVLTFKRVAHRSEEVTL